MKSRGKQRTKIGEGNSILIIYTGGTMGMSYGKDGKTLVPFNFQTVLKNLPELHRFDLKISVSAFQKPLDSSNMKPDHWIQLAETIRENYDRFDGFLILHGTDTMAYTASALSFLLENLAKPVILTGAQLPIDIPRSDARENFVTALEIAAARKDGKPLVQEVCIYFDYLLLRGNRSRKVQSTHFDAFISENFPHLAKAGINIEFAEEQLFRPSGKKLKVYNQLNSDILVLKLFPGLSERILRKTLETDGFAGLILETFGAGNAPTDEWFLKTLRQTIDKGIPVMNVSQCIGGKVTQGKYLTSRKLDEIGVISGKDITIEAAVTKLMFSVANKPYKSNISHTLQTSLRGEME